MRILILGVYGMLGHRLFAHMSERFETFGTSRQLLDGPVVRKFIDNCRVIPAVFAEDTEGIEEAIDKTDPDTVINCIGIVKQLEVAKDPVKMIYVNALFPHKLSGICRSRNIRLIHFSTDCIFSGKKGKYRTDDISDAEDFYGRTKYLGEISGDGCITIRSSLIGRELNTHTGLVEWFLSQEGETVRGYRNAIYSGFTTVEMARIISNVVTNHKSLSGVWQVSSDPISKYEILDLLRSKFNIDVELEPDYDFFCDRSLDGDEFNRRVGYCPPSWESMIDGLSMDSHLYRDSSGE